MKIVFPEIKNPNIQAAIKASDIEAIPADTLVEACEILREGGADAMIAGIDHSTRDVILAARDHLGATGKTFTSCCYFEHPAAVAADPSLSSPSLTKPSHANPPSSPASTGAPAPTAEHPHPTSAPIIIADTAAVKQPTEDQLYDICLQTHATATHLFETPRLALLSFSTYGSGGHDDSMTKIQQVVARVRAAHPEIIIDGEMQLDAALDPRVATKKCPGSPVASQANVLICPDLNVGNILYKSLEYFAGYRAAGPILQGFKKPISDLSRGSTAEDIALTIKTLRRICE